ncbi:MAG: threonine synthase, partial [Ktedonobacterales bacterium]|nr:threonine synthase [Ktedonobacterales bacterium]
LWRYAELLPVARVDERVSLGEGATPLLPLPWLSAELDAQVWLKDEGLNPTGSFKARGAAVGVSRARALGARTIALPTAGNAGAAWAAYGARAGVSVVVAMPRDAPPLTRQEVRLYGARLHLVDGLISDAGRWVAEGVRDEGWYDASTFKEPYRLEGKKTLGLEIAEQLDWNPPDVILYPTGGGVGLIGLWKAFAELRALGWMTADRPAPRLVVVQAAGCAPVVRAWEAGATTTAFWEGAATVAAGLRVPGPLAGSLALRALRETSGTALAVADDELRRALGELGRAGLWVCPEGAALLPAVRRLRAQGWLRSGERVVLLNTGSGLVYPDVSPLE